MPSMDKQSGVTYLQDHAQKVARSSKIVVIGGGAVGVQVATDIKELYPAKSVTLVHSRSRLMHNFHPSLNQIIVDRCIELGVETRLGLRVKLPAGEQYPIDGNVFDVELEDGSLLEADIAVSLIFTLPADFRS
jgi:NADH dehydrogenase FAD-containing subunit